MDFYPSGSFRIHRFYIDYKLGENDLIRVYVPLFDTYLNIQEDFY